MSVRYRLFVIVGLLFCAIFVGSFFVENRLGMKGASELKADLITFYKDLEKEKRDNMQNIVRSVFYRRLGEVNAALEVVSRFRRVKEFFAPTKENKEKGTWISAASLLQDRETIDLIQNTYEDKVSAFIIPRHEGLRDTMREDIDDDLCWVYVEEEKTPYLGVALHLASDSKTAPSETEPVPGIVPSVYVLYRPEVLASLSLENVRQVFDSQKGLIPLSVPFMGGFKLNLSSFLDGLNKAKAFVLSEAQTLSKEDAAHSPLPRLSPAQGCTTQTCFLDERVSYVNQIFMIWELCCLLETKIMDASFSASAISFFPDSTGKGGGILASDVLFMTSKFDAKAFYAHYAEDRQEPVVTSHTALIADKERGKLYVGNVAELSVGSGDKANAGFITLAFDVENVLKNLSTGYRQMAWVVSQNAIFSCLGSDGVLQGAPEVSAEDMTRLLSEDLGLYSIGGQSYYFVHLTPLQGLDVHIFFFTRAGEEFSLMRKLSDHFQDILGTISYQRRFVIAAGLFILLIGLLDLSKKITRPVVLMSEAARSVARGKLQDVVIPKFSLGKNNEVQQLSIAFSEMIEGLKEKERVKGVLDKVVSHDIASVILKGDVHLGGEDKVVTMFFADIRNFTHLTQNMPPHQVIELVNTCMTKLSHVISHHHGVIDKYIGDEVMVLFGAPVAHEDSAYQAVLCAKNVMQELNMWNEERAKCSLPAVTMGVGIHTGKVCAGNMGAEDRLNYTVIGSNVNLAARLCSKAPAGEIWLTHDTLAAPFVKDHVSVDDMGPIAFKGFDEPKNVYRVKEVKG